MAAEGRSGVSITVVATIFAALMAAIITAFVGLLIDVKSDQSLLISRYDERTATADAQLHGIREELSINRSARTKIREDISGIQQQISGLELVEAELLALVKQVNEAKGIQMRIVNDIGILRGLMKHHMLIRHGGGDSRERDTFLELEGQGPR